MRLAGVFLREKAIALLLGPAGTGLFAIYLNLYEWFLQAGGLGLRSSGVRYIAAIQENVAERAEVIKALKAALAAHALICMFAICVFREQLAVNLFGSKDLAVEVMLLGVAVSIGLVAAAYLAVLQGMSEIYLVARASVVSIVVSVPIGILAVIALGEAGLVYFLVVQQGLLAFFSWWFCKRIRFETRANTATLGLAAHWLALIRLGFAFCLGGLFTITALLALRLMITETLDASAAGYFAAAWGLSSIAVAVIVESIGVNYFPKLAASIHHSNEAKYVVDEHMTLALSLGGGLLLMMIAIAPWLIPALFSGKYGPAVPLLQWMLLGGIIKLMSSITGLSLAASASGMLFIVVQAVFNISYLGASYVLLPKLGLIVTGYAFFACYFIHFLFVGVILKKKFNVVVSWKLMLWGALLVVGGSVVMIISRASELVSVGVAMALTLVFSSVSLIKYRKEIWSAE